MSEENQTWMLKIAENSQSIPINEKIVERIIFSLEGLSIRKTLDMDGPNMALYSLSSPLAQIEFENQRGKTLVVEQGLINPIDNSTYIAIKNSPIIYQIEVFVPIWENIDQSFFLQEETQKIP